MMLFLIILLIVLWCIRVMGHLLDAREATPSEIIVIVLCAIGILILCIERMIT